MKVLAWMLTAAAVFIGADVFVKSTWVVPTSDAATAETGLLGSMEGGNGIPRPPD